MTGKYIPNPPAAAPAIERPAADLLVAPATTKPARRRVWSRYLIALVSITLMVGELIAAQTDLSRAPDDASAIQIVQLWTPHLYYLMLIIGLTIAAYVWSRASE